MLEGTSVRAVLGPTNTGKTHRAVERMLSYDSGMIGLPLRLLAREVYDRVTPLVGERRVALVTGEEKRIPERPAYWVCTVEAMPTGREVDFVAVDEIQLAADEQRGHVFTARLLSARGRRETWFLGAETMRAAITELVPAARIESHPRLSRLSFRGMDRLGQLPPRSAIVAFSATQVFELGERVRRARGGVAVVMGALSPRTRNAQVAMFQAGEVDHLVATDAIGMGLNLHVGHVAFAALRKFDGRVVRELATGELAQIAGRAGRYQNDGTFGTLDPVMLSDEAALDVTSHRFAPVTRLWWRSEDLDFSSADGLVESLRVRPRSRWLRLADEAEDGASLALLLADPRVRDRARGEDRVRLLWDVCRIPDFRKLLIETHAALLTEVFLELSAAGQLGDDWMAPRVRALDDVAGEVETLTDRLAKIRTFSFIASHGGWTASPAEWQAKTRDVEDRLSDALHEQLVMRFVERGKRGKGGKAGPRTRAPAMVEGARGRTQAAESPTVDASHPFASLLRLRGAVAKGPEPAPAPGEGAWIEALVAAPHGSFALDQAGTVSFGDKRIGRLVGGARLLHPEARVTADELDAGARLRVGRRLTAFARDVVDELLGSLRGEAYASLGPAGRGVVYQLEQGLGTAVASTLDVQLASLSAADRDGLASMGVVLGAHVLFVPRLLSHASLASRAALVSAHLGRPVRIPQPGAVSFAPDRSLAPATYLALGHVVLGPRAVRADVAERVAIAVAGWSEDASGDEGELAHWLGCPRKVVADVVAALRPRRPEEPIAS